MGDKLLALMNRFGPGRCIRIPIAGIGEFPATVSNNGASEAGQSAAEVRLTSHLSRRQKLPQEIAADYPAAFKGSVICNDSADKLPSVKIFLGEGKKSFTQVRKSIVRHL